MGLLDFLPLGFGGASTNVPAFRQGAERDPTDLQVKSLLYLFKRLRINRLAPFSSGETLRYTDGKLWDSGSGSQEANVQKLDVQFNLPRFQRLLVEDEQRVLIDWPKNKFRALCFLSEHPRLAVPTSTSEKGIIPNFKDYKDRPVQNYAFSVLPVNTSISARDLALDLAQSLLYFEHHSYITFKSRIQTAEKAVAKFSERDSSMVNLTEQTKADIVTEYLKELAFLVQLVRIYQQHVKPKETETPLGSPKKTLSASPRTLRPAKSFSQLPNVGNAPSRPSLSPKKSMASLSGSPKKGISEFSSEKGDSSPSKWDSSPSKWDSSPRKHLLARPSISNFKANELYNPVTSPPISVMSPESKAAGLGALSSHSSETGRENPEMWEKCKVSIRQKLAHEKEILGKEKR